MWKIRFSATVAAVALATSFAQLSSAMAEESDNLNLTIGLRGWGSDWTTWRAQNVFYNDGPVQVSEPLNSNTRFVLTPQIGLRFGDYIASASYLVKETYQLSGALNATSASRSELDVNAGYYVLAGLAVTLGYKEITQDYVGGPFKWTGPTVGMGGSVPLGETNWSLYGNYGFGRLRLTVPVSSADASSRTSFNANYSVIEAGLSYAFSVSRFIKALRLTAGYRAQVLNTRDYQLIGSTAPNERDFTQGPTVGFSASL